MDDAYIDYNTLAAIRKKHRNQTIIFCTGTYDLAHPGHILFFEDCKKLGDILVVAAGNDLACKKAKGDDRPVLNEHLRLKMLASLKPVDYCFLHRHPRPHEEYHNAFLEEIFEQLQPNKYVVNTDATEIPFRQTVADRHGVELVILDRWCPPEFDNVSTTKIIKKVKSLKEH